VNIVDTVPHRAPLVLSIRNALNLEFSDQNSDEFCYDTEETFHKKLVNIGGFALSNINEQMLTAANWAISVGGRIGESQIGYDRWVDIYLKKCEMGHTISQLNFTEKVIDKNFVQWINWQLQFNGSKKIIIGSNSGLRCWFLSWLYCLIGQTHIMNYLSNNKHQSDGHLLLNKILFTLKIAIKQQNKQALDTITQFIEVLLQGHYCWWGDYGAVETAQAITEKLAPGIMQNFSTKCKAWCKCQTHQQYNDSTFYVCKLVFNYHTDWDSATGDIVSHEQNNTMCGKPDVISGAWCSTNSSDRIYTVLANSDSCFILYFEYGIPNLMWRDLQLGKLIKIGLFYRLIDTAIFRIDSNHFVAAYLCDYHSTVQTRIKKKWIKLETKKSKIMKFVGCKRTECHWIFVKPAPRSCCFCEERDNGSMLQCPKCNTLVHQQCVQDLGLLHNLQWDGNNCDICNENNFLFGPN